AFRCPNHLAQAAVAELLVAEEIDPLDAGNAAFVDLEYEIDAILGQLDDLGFHGRRKSAAAPIEVENPLYVALHFGARVDDAGAQLHFRVERLIVQLAVTLEGDAVDDRIFNHTHTEIVALHPKRDVGKQSGGK